jgi:putative ABC transport system permease protein
VPIVTARIAAINGRSVRDILSDRATRRVQPWTVRREYRNTYRDTLTASETLVSGAWWDGPRPAGTPARISLEQELAADLAVTVGDNITWDVQGVEIESIITSLRTVDWARFDTNFFVVFEPGVLESAPQSVVLVTHVPDERARAEAQRDIVTDYPNISLVDVATIQVALERIIGNAILAIRFMAVFSVAAGIVVLIGAVSASRFQRVRESVLLRTLGATRRQIRRILLTEYATLGLLAGAVGTALGTVAGALVVSRVFEMDFILPLAPMFVALVGVTALAAGVGLANSREALRKTPLAVLRDAES